MKRHLALLVVFALSGPVAASADTSWIFAPSRYSHEATNGQRVSQYSPPATAYYRSDPTYLQSGYHHSRTSFQFGDVSDNHHVVETWGAGEWIRPYGEWLRPYRWGATPYGPWGSAYGPWTTPWGTTAGPQGQDWPATSVYRPGYPGAQSPPYARQQPPMPGQQSPMPYQQQPMPYQQQAMPYQQQPMPSPPHANPPRSSERDSEAH